MKLNKNFLLKFKYECSVFAALSLNFLLFFTKDELMSNVLYPLHLVDTRIGFISRTLVGSITGLIWDNPTKNNVTVLHIVIIVLSFFVTALVLGRYIKKAEGETQNNLFLLSLIVCVFPYGFMTYINLFELLDIYWLLTVSLCILASENKYTAFLIPVFIITGMWVHYSFLLAFVPVIYVLCIDKALNGNSLHGKILLTVMIAVSVSAAVYFNTTSRVFDVLSFEDFLNYIVEKAGDPVTALERHIGAGFRPYNELKKVYNIGENIPDNIPEILKNLIGSFQFALRDTTLSSIFADFILASPIALFFGKIWKEAIKKAESSKDKFIYFLCLITPLVQLVACFLSSDTSRWLSDMVISDLLLLIICTSGKNSAAALTMNKLMKKLNEHKAALILLILFYMNIVFVW